MAVSRCPEYPAPSHRVSVRIWSVRTDPAESASAFPAYLHRGGSHTFDYPVHGFHDHDADSGDVSDMSPG
jgi:hypothetical protein